MKAHRLILPILLLAVTTAMAQDTSYNFDKTAEFSKYKTYRWEKHPQSTDLDQLTMNKLAAAFDAELAKKGLMKTESPTPDLIIVYQLAVKNEKEINTFSSGYGAGPGWGGYGGYGGMYGGSSSSTTTVSTITIGSLNLDMYDAPKKTLVWRGLASKTLDVKAKPEKQEKNMAKAAAKMLKYYPPPPPKK